MNLEDDHFLEKIHIDALRVLEEVGVKCNSPEVRQVFEETGLAAFDETTGHLHVLAPLVEQAIDMAPKRDQYWIPENAFGVGGTAPFVYDDDTGELVLPTFEPGSQSHRHDRRALSQADLRSYRDRGGDCPSPATARDERRPHCPVFHY